MLAEHHGEGSISSSHTEPVHKRLHFSVLLLCLFFFFLFTNSNKFTAIFFSFPQTKSMQLKSYILCLKYFLILCLLKIKSPAIFRFGNLHFIWLGREHSSSNCPLRFSASHLSDRISLEIKGLNLMTYLFHLYPPPPYHILSISRSFSKLLCLDVRIAGGENWLYGMS